MTEAWALSASINTASFWLLLVALVSPFRSLILLVAGWQAGSLQSQKISLDASLICINTQ
jgi:hypothetical protein